MQLGTRWDGSGVAVKAKSRENVCPYPRLAPQEFGRRGVVTRSFLTFCSPERAETTDVLSLVTPRQERMNGSGVKERFLNWCFKLFSHFQSFSRKEVSKFDAFPTKEKSALGPLLPSLFSTSFLSSTACLDVQTSVSV